MCAAADSPSAFADNVEGRCALCSAAIIYRPGAPDEPAHICVSCALSEWRVRAEEGRPQLTATVSWIHHPDNLRATLNHGI